MAGVILNLRDSVDDLGHPRQGPKICAEPLGPCTFPEGPIDLLSLLATESGQTACATRATKRGHAAPSPLSIPPAHALAAHPKSVSHV